METDDLDTLFALPLSEQAYSQLQNLQLELSSVPYNDDQEDRWGVHMGFQYLFLSEVLCFFLQKYDHFPLLYLALEV